MSDLLFQTIGLVQEANKLSSSPFFSPSNMSNWIVHTLLGFLRERHVYPDDSPLTPRQLFDLMEEQEKGRLSNKLAKACLEALLEEGLARREKEEEEEELTVSALIEKHGWTQVDDASALEAVCMEILARASSEKALHDYRYNSKKNNLKYFLGQAMKETKGKANPPLLREVMTRLLDDF